MACPGLTHAHASLLPRTKGYQPASSCVNIHITHMLLACVHCFRSLDPPKPKSLQGAKVGGGASGSAPKRSTPPPPPVTVAAAPVSSSAPQKAGGTSAGNGGGIGGGSGGLGPASMAAGGSIGPGGPAGLASHSAAAATRPGTGKSEPLLGRSHSPAEGKGSWLF